MRRYRLLFGHATATVLAVACVIAFGDGVRIGDTKNHVEAALGGPKGPSGTASDLWYLCDEGPVRYKDGRVAELRIKPLSAHDVGVPRTAPTSGVECPKRETTPRLEAPRQPPTKERTMAPFGGRYSGDIRDDSGDLIRKRSLGWTPEGIRAVDLGDGESMEFVWIPSGALEVWSNEGQTGGKLLYDVKVTKDFWLSKYEVTNRQYRRFLDRSGYNGKNDADPSYLSHFRDSKSPLAQDNQPVIWISWKNAQAFCKWLSSPPISLARLPTEAEWEYACRAGAKAHFFLGSSDRDLAEIGWYKGNSRGVTHAVGEKKPNSFGLYDMHGNVWEWCQDWYGLFPSGNIDPTGPLSGVHRVRRGGCWVSSSLDCRSGKRGGNPATHTNNGIGFRVLVEGFLPPPAL
jgi:formylglycine-generating enzyme required for sulfatase activity